MAVYKPYKIRTQAGKLLSEHYSIDEVRAWLTNNLPEQAVVWVDHNDGQGEEFVESWEYELAAVGRVAGEDY